MPIYRRLDCRPLITFTATGTSPSIH
uniref:Uncharacterized protein n=1 Tax=Rhizophora mucronata TaxID=61149 RepID=A0A2P2PU84_RHIMU